MTLPNYFLADLPVGTVFSAEMIREACLTLKRNRLQYLAVRRTQSLVRALILTAENWLDDEFPLRRLAAQEGPAQTGFSQATLMGGLDAYFKQLNGEHIESLLLQELGHLQRLDGMASPPNEHRSQRFAMATGPDLLVHITGGLVPNPVINNLVLGLLLRSAQFVKCARGTSFIPRLFAHALRQTEAKLGACIEIAEWPGGTEELERELFSQARCVTVMGSDETLQAVRQKLPPRVSFVGYGHRVSFGYITREALSGWRFKKIVAAAADDVTAWNQLGCLSPHAFYVEDNATGDAEQFASQLAAELDRREAAEPRGPVDAGAASRIAMMRGFYEVRQAHSLGTRQWASEGSTAWTVIFEVDPRFQVSCLNRFIYVKATPGLKEALEGVDRFQGQVSTVGVAAGETELEEIAAQLAHWGVTRICPLGRMQHPPLTWRHDGRPPLGDLVTWTDWEQ
ncbi:MAG: hypothetical protein FJ386_03945 [Verrucomicrobia bacterium]|nr:hypothetical protein [Verrucomicrobiota bacterium]